MGDLATVVREIEQHAAEAGWDRPAQLFALVPTSDLIAREPGLAGVISESSSLTPVQQEELPDQELESVLRQIVWPGSVAGCAVVLERLVLPPDAEQELPEDRDAAAAFAAAHPAREDVRIVAAVDREGAASCALRLRSHDEAGSVMVGDELVPGLVDLLRDTLKADAPEDGRAPGGGEG